jgi:hydroxymethylpyrimidine/phosphomethylpyrimidine kinase
MSRSRVLPRAQIDAVFEDIDVAAVKIGMFASAAVVETVADRL